MKTALILNRRCIRHPQRGGAEIYTFEMARAIQECGYQVTLLSSKVKGAPAEEEIDGIRFIRRGNDFFTHFCGLAYAIRTKPSLLVDEFNGIGYGTFFIRNSVLLIHQMYGEFWSVELGPAGRIFEILERQFLKLYRKKPTITISASTAADLGLLGFKNITIITDGLEVTPLAAMPEKKDRLTLVYLGRIKKTKNPEDAVKAFLIVQKAIPGACLRVVGDGPFLPALREKYRDNAGISFYGFVDFKKKYELMADAHFLLVPSIREGWGQIVIQANAVGTPVIGYNVRGLRDSIRHGQTGILVSDFKEMAEQIIMLWNNSPRREELGRKALDWSRSFSYGRMRSDFVRYLKNIAGSSG